MHTLPAPGLLPVDDVYLELGDERPHRTANDASFEIRARTVRIFCMARRQVVLLEA